MSFQKQYDIDTWNSILVCPLPKWPRIHADTPILSFDEDCSQPKRKVPSDLTNKCLRKRLSNLK